jgi:hypothetical protein
MYFCTGPPAGYSFFTTRDKIVMAVGFDYTIRAGRYLTLHCRRTDVPRLICHLRLDTAFRAFGIELDFLHVQIWLLNFPILKDSKS